MPDRTSAAKTSHEKLEQPAARTAALPKKSELSAPSEVETSKLGSPAQTFAEIVAATKVPLGYVARVCGLPGTPGRSNPPVTKAISRGEYSSGLSPTTLSIAVARSHDEFQMLVTGVATSATPDLAQDSNRFADMITATATTETAEIQTSPLAVARRWLRWNKPVAVAHFYEGQAERLGQKGSSNQLKIHHSVFKVYLAGEDVPTFKALQDHVRKAGVALNSGLEMNWCTSYAARALSEGKTDLERVIATIVARRAETKAELLGASYQVWRTLKAFDAAREAGYVPDAELAYLLGEMKINPESNEYKFATTVNRTGSILRAIPEFVSGIKRDLKTIRSGAESQLKSEGYDGIEYAEAIGLRFSDRELQVRASLLEAMRAMPGTTLAELAGVKGDAAVDVVRMASARMNAEGCDLNVLAALVHSAPPGSSMIPVPGVTRAALAKETLGPLTAPGVLVALSSSDAKAYSQFAALLPHAFETYVEGRGGVPSPLGVAMRIWGLERTDIAGIGENFNPLISRRPLKDETGRNIPTSAAEEKALSDISAWGLARVVPALRTYTALLHRFAPQKLIPVILEGAKGEVLGNIQKSGKIADGSLVPPLYVMKRYAALAGLSWGPAFEIGWCLSYPKQLEHHVFRRGLLTAIAGERFEMPEGDTRGFSPYDVLVRFAEKNKLDSAKVASLEKYARSGKVSAQATYTDVTSRLDDLSASRRDRFLVALKGSATVDEALMKWWRTLGGNEDISRLVGSLLKWVDVPPPPDITELDEAHKRDALLDYKKALSDRRAGLELNDVLEAVRMLPGVTDEHLLTFGKQVRFINERSATVADASVVRETSEAKRPTRQNETTTTSPVKEPAAVTHVPSPPPVAPQIAFTVEELRGSVDAKFHTLTLKVHQGEVVQLADVFRLLPALRARVEKIARHLGDDTLGLVTALGFFSSPSQALSILERRVDTKADPVFSSGQAYKHIAQLYERHQRDAAGNLPVTMAGELFRSAV